MNHSINEVVNRGSQVHQYPQKARPQITPVNKTIVINITPISAEAAL